MQRFQRIFHKLLFPGLGVVLPSVPIAAALLIYIFAFALENSPIAYPAYMFSAYSLTIVCILVIKNGKSAKDRLKSQMHKIPLVRRYFTDVSFKLQVSLYLSLGFNILYAVMKFFYGIYYHSVWFGTLAVYYIMLAMMRFLLLHHANRNAFGKNLISELKQYRLCGIILVLMNAALSGVVILVVRNLYASICGTDVAVYMHGPNTGHRVTVGGEFGHEMVSEVIQAGKNVQGIHVGDRVYPYPLLAKGDPKRPVDILAMTYSQHALIGSGGYFPVDVEDVITVMASGQWDIESIITDEFPLEQLPQAIERAARVDEALNVVIRY